MPRTLQPAAIFAALLGFLPNHLAILDKKRVLTYYVDERAGSRDAKRACWLSGMADPQRNFTDNGFWSVDWSRRSEADGRLAWRKLSSDEPCDIAWLPLPEPRCVIASVSVLPMRLSQFKYTLRSILSQTRPPDLVYVVLPWRLKDRGKRLTRVTYPSPLPRFLFQDSRVRLIRPPEAEDLGTLDMLLPTLRALRSKAPPGCTAPHRVWVVNDDVHYDPGLLEALLACAARHPDAACGSSGGRGRTSSGVLIQKVADSDGPQAINRHVAPFLQAGGEVEVEVLQSYAGILYRTDFFDEDFLTFPSAANELALLENDWWFAGYLHARGVRHLHLPAVRPWWRATESWAVNSLSWMWYRVGHNTAKDAVIDHYAQKHGVWRRECAGLKYESTGKGAKPVGCEDSVSSMTHDPAEDRRYTAHCDPTWTEDAKGPPIPNKIMFNCVAPLCPEGERLMVGSKFRSLRSSVVDTISMHPGAAVTYYGSTACRAAIVRAHSEALAQFFDNETQDPRYKSDVCRLAMLYQHGGFYFDNDMRVLQDVRDRVPRDVSLATVISYSDKRQLMNSFIAATPCHPVISRALRLSLEWYQMARQAPSMRQVGLMGPTVLGKALRGWLGVEYFLQTGRMARKRGGPFGSVYLFEERDDLAKYGLAPGNFSWIGCNLVFADEAQAISWAREC